MENSGLQHEGVRLRSVRRRRQRGVRQVGVGALLCRGMVGQVCGGDSVVSGVSVWQHPGYYLGRWDAVGARELRVVEGRERLVMAYGDHGLQPAFRYLLWEVYELSGEAGVHVELVSNLVEIASRLFSSSSGDCILSAHRQFG